MSAQVVKARKLQLIIESHSEHLLRRVEQRIAEGELHPEDTALYFCDMGSSKSRLTALNVDLYGNIRNWPKDFFGDEFGESTAIHESGYSVGCRPPNEMICASRYQL